MHPTLPLDTLSQKAPPAVSSSGSAVSGIRDAEDAHGAGRPAPGIDVFASGHANALNACAHVSAHHRS